MERNKLIEQTSEKFPFLTGIEYCGQEYVGIVVNYDNTICTFYDIDALPSDRDKKSFLELGDTWWWESNRLVPINLFLKEEWIVFKPYLRTFNNKSLEIIHGPVCSMMELHKRRSKRRSITLVKRMP